MVKAKFYVLEKVFQGFPKESDFKLEEEELPPVKNGEFLCEALYLSVDPYMRAYASNPDWAPRKVAFVGSQIAKIIESKNNKFPVGKYVLGYFGWRTHTISNGEFDVHFAPVLLPDIGDLPLSLYLGVLGMPGNTSYFGFLEICQPKAGETVVVSGAAGAVGSHVGQIAKIKGCTVIGIAGSEEKGKWLTEQLGFDHFINYKTADLDSVLKEIAPKGIDCYFDNVGGEMSSTVMSQMNNFGRISVCGSISNYNDIQKTKEFLCEALYLSVDPYMRAYASNPDWAPRKVAFVGSQIAKINESKNPKFPVGKYVLGYFGWRTHTISNGEFDVHFAPVLLPDIGDLPLSLYLGVLGMPGNTSYFGFLEICQPKAGETVVVSGAAGAVGSHVGQIAKIKGCTVIGIAGSEEKGKWLTEQLGFDHFINYKTADLDSVLKEVAPKGIDCYFDNVGGEMSSTVMSQMNNFGRISVCGSISNYNDIQKAKVTVLQPIVVTKQLKMEGFIVKRWNDRWLEGIEQNLQWIKEGKLKYHETITEGFENIFQCFTGMLRGENIGKAIVKV